MCSNLSNSDLFYKKYLIIIIMAHRRLKPQLAELR